MIRTALITAALALSLSACSVMRGQESARDFGSDTAITSSVKSKFATSPDVATTSISVETMQGVVQLSGFAKSADEKKRAEEIAKDVKGVKSIRNDIIVRP